MPIGEETGQPFRYTGRRFDAKTGLYYYRARYYAPTLGRFLQTDPIGYGDNMNLYAYVGNDPVNAKDPSGNQEFPTNIKRKLGSSRNKRPDLGPSSKGRDFAEFNGLSQRVRTSNAAISGLNSGVLKDKFADTAEKSTGVTLAIISGQAVAALRGIAALSAGAGEKVVTLKRAIDSSSPSAPKARIPTSDSGPPDLDGNAPGVGTPDPNPIPLEESGPKTTTQKIVVGVQKALEFLESLF